MKEVCVGRGGCRERTEVKWCDDGGNDGENSGKMYEYMS